MNVPTVRSAIEELRSAVSTTSATAIARFPSLWIWRGEAKWEYDSVDDFYADFGEGSLTVGAVHAEIGFPDEVGYHGTVSVTQRGSSVEVQVSHPAQSTVNRVMQVFADAEPSLRTPPPPPPPKPKPRVFIGHGGTSQQWTLLKNHLTDHHQYEVVAYETGARAGHTIRDVLEDMLAASSFALLVFTAEDEQASLDGEPGRMRARQNVVHEAGLFQGRLGFARAVVLLEEGVENLSNLAGVQYIPFSRNNIRETFGDVLATLKREFSPA